MNTNPRGMLADCQLLNFSNLVSSYSFEVFHVWESASVEKWMVGQFQSISSEVNATSE